MAELNQILGALLRDIAQARFSSDLYSKNISRYYEQNSLLRRFPVPRAEIEEVEIDLKFALSEIDFQGDTGEGREAQLAPFFERQSNALASRFIEGAREIARARNKVGLAQELSRESFRIDVRQDILRYFMHNYPHLIDGGGHLNVKEALEGLRPVLSGALTYRMERAGAKDPDLRREIVDTVDLSAALKEMAGEALQYWRQGGDCRINTEVSGSALGELPAEVISSVKIKVGLRNYTWTQVESKEEGRTWRSLSPE